MTQLTYSQAIREALREEMLRDDSVIVMGEDVGVMNGAHGATRGLLDEFSEKRVRDMPISETAIIGTAIGAAMTGMRPVAEIMSMDFITCCMDELVNQAAKMKYMTGGQAKLPLTVRMPFGAGFSAAAQHSQSLEAWFTHTPGLKVVMPSNPHDAKGLLKTSIRDDDPVIFLEHKALYDSIKEDLPAGEHLVPLGKADIKKEGNDVTVIATSMMVHKALIADKKLEIEGISVEVIDLRCLVPIDKDVIINSVKKTGKVIIVEEAVKRSGYSANIAAMIVEEAFDCLDAPVIRIGAANTPAPFNPNLEARYLPDEEDIYQKIKNLST